MTDALHHLHKRKRASKKGEPYPHPDKTKNIIDKLVYCAGIMVPGVTAIQAWKIWSERNADGISLTAWGGYIIGNFIWISYGLVHKDRPILLMYTLLLITNAAVVIGALIF